MKLRDILFMIGISIFMATIVVFHKPKVEYKMADIDVNINEENVLYENSHSDI